MSSCPFFTWHFFFPSEPRSPMSTCMSFRNKEKKGKEREKGNTCIACRFSRSHSAESLIAIFIHKIMSFRHMIIYLLSISIHQWTPHSTSSSMLYQNDRHRPGQGSVIRHNAHWSTKNNKHTRALHGKVTPN